MSSESSLDQSRDTVVPPYEKPAPAGVTINRFNRAAIDKAFGKGRSNLGFTKRGKLSQKIAKTSPAIKSGMVFLRKDGKVDRRCAGFKRGLVLLDSDGHVDRTSVLCAQQVVLLKKPGTISKKSPAVKSGLVRLNRDKSVQRDSEACTEGFTRFKENGSIDVKTSFFCQPRQLCFQDTNGSHIHSFEVADKITQIAGLRFTEKETDRMLKAINQQGNLRIKTRGGNMSGAITGPKESGDRSLDGKLCKALDTVKNGEEVQLPLNVSQRASRVIHEILTGDYAVQYKESARELFSRMTCPAGFRIVRKNAAFSTPSTLGPYNLVHEPAVKIPQMPKAKGSSTIMKPYKIFDKAGSRAPKLNRVVAQVQENSDPSLENRVRGAKSGTDKKKTCKKVRFVESQKSNKERLSQQQQQQQPKSAKERFQHVAKRAPRKKGQLPPKVINLQSGSSQEAYTSAFGEFTGSFHVSRGKANNRPLFKGPKGRIFYLSSDNRRMYV